MIHALYALVALCLSTAFLVGLAVGREFDRWRWQKRCDAPWPDHN